MPAGFGGRGDKRPVSGGARPSRRGDPALLSLSEQAALERAPKLRQAGRAIADAAGKAWNSPNTALGLIYGGAGYALGQVHRPPNTPAPRVRLSHNAVDNPASPLGGLTLGNVTLYPDDPYDPTDKGWAKYRRDYGRPVQEHEEQHTYQGQQLGPVYLPSNIAGGLLGLVRDHDWGGPSNWNERGPKMNPPRPWAQRR